MEFDDDLELNIGDGNDDEAAIMASFGVAETSIQPAKPLAEKRVVSTNKTAIDRSSSNSKEKRMNVIKALPPKKIGSRQAETRDDDSESEDAEEELSPPSSQLQKRDNDTSGSNEQPEPKKPKFARLTAEEDPNSFHARPLELARMGEKRRKENAIAKRPELSQIFSRTPFSSLPLDKKLSAHLEGAGSSGGMGLATSTRVQSVVVPLLSQPQNMLMKSQTGSGKTLAYLIPLINDLMTLQPPITREGGTRALVIAPTRELCAQIASVLAKITQCCVKVVGGSITGGERKKSEKARLRKGVVVLVATPGRLLDHLKTTESFTLQSLRWVVLDEVDRLLDMGFEQTVLETLSIIRGANLPGLKDRSQGQGQDKSEPSHGNKQKQNKATKEGGVGTLTQRWTQQHAKLAKQVTNTRNLFHIMASATLTRAVRELAMPVMGGAGFVVVDADREAVDYVATPEDLHNLGSSKAATAAVKVTKATPSQPKEKNQSKKEEVLPEPGVIDFYDEEEDSDDADKGDDGSDGGEEEEDEEGEGDDDCSNADDHDESLDDDDIEDESDDDDGGSNNADADAAEKEEASSGGRSKKMRMTLEKNEVVDAPQQLAQYYMMVTCKWRLAALMCFLRTHSHQKIMVFFSTCDSVDFHCLLFREAQWPDDLDAVVETSDSAGEGGGGGANVGAGKGKGKPFIGGGMHRSRSSMNSSSSSGNMDAGVAQKEKEGQFIEPLGASFTGIFGKDCNMYRLHGNVPQNTRQTVYKEFCAAKSGIMFCTDVAARGLDLPEVDWILQYDPPCETTDYVHRVGRTARRGRPGSALLFLLPTEAQYVQLLCSHSLNPEPLSLQSLFIDVSKFVEGSKRFKNFDEMTAVILQRRLETVVNSNRPLFGAARQAYSSSIRAYATHSVDTKGIFKIQSLHLGHVARSFAMRESPKNIRMHEDVISKIFNGAFSRSLVVDKEAKQRARDEKYSLSRNSKEKSKGGGKNNNKGKGSGSGSSKAIIISSPGVPLSGRGGGEGGGEGGGGGGGGSNGKNGKQKYSSLTGKTVPLRMMTASGNFRKSGGGYFKKELRAQTTSEFSS